MEWRPSAPILWPCRLSRLICCCSYGVCLTAASATQIDWNGFPFSTNLTSTGQPWDDTWVAELGSFTGSFTPPRRQHPAMGRRLAGGFPQRLSTGHPVFWRQL